MGHNHDDHDHDDSLIKEGDPTILVDVEPVEKGMFTRRRMSMVFQSEKIVILSV